jgi:hypothetical protein
MLFCFHVKFDPYFFVAIFCSVYFFKLDLFFQFHPSILDWLGIEFHDFFFLQGDFNLMTWVTGLKG